MESRYRTLRTMRLRMPWNMRQMDLSLLLRRPLHCFLLSVLLVPAFAGGAMAPLEPESPAYREGREALDRRDWRTAETAFQRATESDPEPDGAFYWLAYSQAKRGRTTAALATVDKLMLQWPNSPWRDDAEALRIELRGGKSLVTGNEGGADDELKLMALAGLAQSDPQRALPMIEKILAGQASTELKEQALFVAGQMGGEAGAEMLVRTARDSRNPEIQESAIQYLGVLGGDRHLATLDELFRSDISRDAKESILEAYMIAGSRDRLLAAARSGSDVELRAEAAQLLGTQGAVDELWQLYQTEKSVEVRESILEGFMISGDGQHLRKVARDSSHKDLQREAIQLLGVMGDHEFLLEILAEARSTEAKTEIVEALGISGRLNDLETLAGDRSQPLEVREAAIEGLGIHGGGEALWKLFQTDDDGLGEALVEGLALAGQADRLFSVVRDRSRSVAVRHQALGALVIVGPSPKVVTGLYRDLEERELREGALELLFTTGAAEELVTIVRTETDPGLRAAAVQFLGLTGSPLAADVLEAILAE